MDIGGSLTKIAYYSTLPLKKIVYDSSEPCTTDEVCSVCTVGIMCLYILHVLNVCVKFELCSLLLLFLLLLFVL